MRARSRAPDAGTREYELTESAGRCPAPPVLSFRFSFSVSHLLPAPANPRADDRRHFRLALAAPGPARSLIRLAPLFVLAAIVLDACSELRPAAVPMRSVELTHGGGRCLAVLLPGRRDEPEEFRAAGFARAVAQRGLHLDLVAVDSHLGYFRAGSIVERLRADVVAPARAAGYDTIWMVGTSLGGLGSLLYLRDHPEDLAGVLALAPYLGDAGVVREIEGAGGPDRWLLQAAPPTADASRELWRWLVPWTRARQGTPLHLGWGKDDALGRSNRMLASLLPSARVYSSAGGHDWRAWEHLWEEFLDRTPLCGRTP